MYAFKFSNFKPRTSSGVHPPLALRRVGPPIFLRNETNPNEIKYPPSVSAFGFRFPSSRARRRDPIHRHVFVKRTRQSSISSSHSSSPSASSSSSHLGGLISHFLLHSSGIFSHHATRVSPSSSSSVSRVAPASLCRVRPSLRAATSLV